MNFCTIVAKNYVPHARVLARSLAAHHPNSHVWTVIIDDFTGYVDPADEPFDVLTPGEVGCDDFIHMAVRYSLLELSTAVKPWLLRHLTGLTGAPVTYLDPDIRVYDSLQRLDDLAARHGVVLMPHSVDVVPLDGRHPTQQNMLLAGVFNLGYVSVGARPDIDRLLGWWAERLLYDCRVDPEHGFFVDQRWFDFVPAVMSDYAIVRDSEYNVAYWNIHSRTLGREDGHYTVDGRPLGFFHFSGFDPEHPLGLSRFQTRTETLTNPILEQLLTDYASELLEQGFLAARTWPYTYGVLGDGQPADDLLRALYHEYVLEEGGHTPSVFTREGMDIFRRWLRGQDPAEPPGLNRVLGQILSQRSDLRHVLTDLDGAGRTSILEWVDEHGKQEYPLLARIGQTEGGGGGVEQRRTLVSRPDATVQRPTAPLREAPWGVNVVGYFRSELGVGEVARQAISALDAKRVPAVPVHGRMIPINRQGHAFATISPADAPYPINLICVNADMLPSFVEEVGDDFFAGRYSIGLWFWEVSRFPDRWRGSLELIDEIWAPTTHIADTLRPLAAVPVTTIRVPVEPPPVVYRTRAELELPDDGFLFLFSFDYLSVFRRKNPLAAIAAFRRAFAPGEGARLVLKCINADRDPQSHSELLAAAAAHEDITVVDRYLSPTDNNSLTAVCDAYVSLHRAEGFGLGMAEAMYHGKPVIATAYSGNLDFMSPSNSLLVDCRSVPIGPGAGPYPEDGEWAEPDLADAVRRMRQLFDDPAGARALGLRAASDIRRTHSADAAGELMLRRLEQIWAEQRGRRPSVPPRRRLPSLDALEVLIEEGPIPSERASKGSARGIAREAAMRVMAPFVHFQQRFNTAVHTVVTELDITIEATRRELLKAREDRARVLADVRRLERLSSTLDAQAINAERLHRDSEGDADRAMYLALSELRVRHGAIEQHPGTPPEVLALDGFELRVFSGNGEDGVLAEILHRIGVSERFFIAFGAGTGRLGACVYLADVAGWRGVFLEANPELHRLLKRKYEARGQIGTTRASATPEGIEDTFRRAEVPTEPDVVVVGSLGEHGPIWEALARHQPRVIVISYGGACAHSSDLRAPAQQAGYRLVHTDLMGTSAFFVREDLTGEAFLSPDDVLVRGARVELDHGAPVGSTGL